MRAVRATSLSWPSVDWLAEGKCGIVGEHCSEEVAMCKGGVDVSWTDVDQAEAVATDWSQQLATCLVLGLCSHAGFLTVPLALAQGSSFQRRPLSLSHMAAFHAQT